MSSGPPLKTTIKLLYFKLKEYGGGKKKTQVVTVQKIRQTLEYLTKILKINTNEQHQQIPAKADLT